MTPAIPILIDRATIAARVEELGRHITRDYRNRSLVLVPILQGSFMFAADLARQIQLDLSVDFLGVRSYGQGSESTGIVQITTDLFRSIDGKDVIVIEDIVDTGLTMSYLLQNLWTRRPRSLRVASLLHKPARSLVAVDIDYLGFTIEDVFVVGYGLDFGQRYRNLPYLGVLEEEEGSLARR